MSRFSLTIFLLLAFAYSPVFAQAPLVEVKLSSKSVRVGEPVSVRVKLLVPTWFVGAPQFPAFEVANAVTRLPADSSYPTSQRIEGETWSGIVREYQIYPLLEASYRIDGQLIKLKWANPGKPPVEGQVQVPSISFSSTVPVGAATLSPYIAGSAFRVERTLAGDSSHLSVGDAVTINLKAELEGMSSMFIPPLWQDVMLEGVSVYIGEPSVSDEGVAVREEKVTLIFETGGSVVVPPRTVSWWQTDSESIEQILLPELIFNIEGPVKQSPTEPVKTESQSSWLLLIACVLLGFGIVWQRRQPVSEPDLEVIAFAALEKALQEKDGLASYSAISRWLAMTDRQHLVLNGAFECLRLKLFSEESTDVDYSQLLADMRSLRRPHSREAISDQGALPGLNP